ncbi:rod-determining factor RdfA [Halorhabdus sp. CUG00001]|uniref:rod-determining factor RdfA n=1 Tax=Halorhabdus sp. CUG00001 TaxID=2600297 RepID=UPI00131C6C66|nr:rod-determining factor RdfA [Halorhabdus sp. CUG00001]
MAESPCSCKVGRVAERYDLSDLDTDLQSRHDAGTSLRALATVLNKRILRTALERAGGDTSTLVSSDRGVDTLFDVLDGSTEATDTERVRVKTRLEQAGVDVEAVTDDWVSHATIKSHLNECLSVDTSRETSITESDAIDTIEWTRTRSENVIAETIERLQNAGLIAVGEPTTSVRARITCEDCGRSYAVRDLLDAGGCACRDDESRPRE